MHYLFRFFFVFMMVINLFNTLDAENSALRPLTVGIITAVQGEYGTLLEKMDSLDIHKKGKRNFYKGKIQGIDVVLTSSCVGKVASAIATTHLILDYHVDMILFIGTAGALDPSLNIGDIVIANSLIQHDLDARPFCPIYEIPLLKIGACEPDPYLQNISLQASQKFIKQDLDKLIPFETFEKFQMLKPKIYEGLVLTGDQVISEDVQKNRLKNNLPDALCVEMEGASVSQACFEYDVPFVVIRIISDFADREHTQIDIGQFLNHIAGFYTVGILDNLFEYINADLVNLSKAE